MSRAVIRCEDAPVPIHAVSQAIVSGDIVQISGQGPLDPATMKCVDGGITEQTTAVLGHLMTIVESAGGAFEDIVMIRIYLSSDENFDAMNEAYDRFVIEHASEAFPCRTTIIAGLVRADMLIEMDAMAIVSN